MRVIQTNKELILAKDVWLNTYEVFCTDCKELRWPTLSEKPTKYICVRCRAGAGNSRRKSGRKGGRASQAANKARIEQEGGKK